MDAEIQAKLDAKLDPNKMAQAQAWIEAVTGQRFAGSFHESLKSGVLLCKLLNTIKPGSVKNINNMTMPFSQRENIANYLKGCSDLGMKEVDKFVTQDLFEGDNLVVVIDNIFALGAMSQKVPGFRGPYLGVKHADENARNFSADVLNQGKSTPSRQTVGSYGYQDESKNPSLGRQIIKDVSGHQASNVATKLSMGSYGIQDENRGSGIDKIIRNPEEFAAQKGAAAANQNQGPGFCGNCGAKRVSSAKFCGGCGQAL